MLSDERAAEFVSELLLETFQRLDESVAKVRTVVPAREAEDYSRAVGQIAGAIVMDILEKLYERHPHLKPPNWETD